METLPEINSVLLAGDEGEVVIEVLIHLDSETVRGIALNPTSGLARGSPVTDTGQPLMVPVGENLLGRFFNVFGSPTDQKESPKAKELRSIHQRPPPISHRTTTSEIFETGIKAIDVLFPLEGGERKGWPLRRSRQSVEVEALYSDRRG